MGHNGNEIFLHGIKPRFPGNIADKPTASLTGKARQVTHDNPVTSSVCVTPCAVRRTRRTWLKLLPSGISVP